VTVKTTVVALVSCENTQVRITQDGRALDGGVVLAGSALHVHVAAKDVDGLNVTTSRAELDLRWRGMAVEFRWLRDGAHGSNEYVAVLPTDLDSASGRSMLIIILIGGWSKSGRALGTRGQCVLLEHTVNIEADEKAPTQYIIGGIVSGSVLTLLLLLLAYQIRDHKEQAKRFFSSFIKYEGVLALKVCWDLWV
jgi:hypothetical protein